MFALLAALCFFLEVIGLGESIEWIALGLLFVAIHLLVTVGPNWLTPWRR